MATDYNFAGASVRARNPFAVLGLSIVTLGIYQWYWWYQINREMRDASQRRIDVSPGMSLLAVTLGALVLVPPLVSTHRTARRAQQMGSLAGRDELLNMWAYWLLILFTGIGGYIYLQWELNKIWTTISRAGAAPASLAAPIEQAPAEPQGPFL